MIVTTNFKTYTIIEDIFKGEFDIYFRVSDGIKFLDLVSVSKIIEDCKFPKSEIGRSKLLDYLKFNELELYNKIKWY